MTYPVAPVVLVIFGGTGDLFRRKLAPSLMTLFEEGRLPKNVRIISTGRTQYTDSEYRSFVSDAIQEILSVQATDHFLSHFTYVSGELHEDSFYSRIQDTILTFEMEMSKESHIVWYCSIAPHLYTDIASGIAAHTHFLKRSLNANSFLIEKPIGHNTLSCLELNNAISRYFDESQITRIEHYLTKETLVRLPAFFQEHKEIYTLMQGDSVQAVDVFFCETLGVEKRGAFYDGVGAFRDVGQNHALEMLAHTCMDYDFNKNGSDISHERIHFLSKLSETDIETVQGQRFQYVGYTNIPGVDSHSQVETAYSVSGVLPKERWKNIPFTLVGGKRLKQKKKCVELRMRDNVQYAGLDLKKITISIDPECIILSYVNGTETVFAFRPNHTPKYQYVEEYSRILDAGFAGSQAYSVSAKEVLMLWKITDRYTSSLEHANKALLMYEPDTDPFIHNN